MSLFDGYLMVDWSSSSVPATGADSIWIAWLRGGDLRLTNPETRVQAMAEIADILREATARGERVLAGFDFPFGYPEGTAHALTGGDWRDLWRLLSDQIIDDDHNANNRFKVAARLNQRFPGVGPFWGHPSRHTYDDLAKTCGQGYGETLPPRNRYAEEGNRAQEVWKLFGIGSVGSQALTGIAALERLRANLPCRVWPLETLGEDEGHVLAEIYPSMLPPHPGESVKDAGQVRRLAEVFAVLDRRGDLREVLRKPLDMPAKVRLEEACMLGQDCVELLTAAMPTYLKDPAAIYRQSFETVRAEADFSKLPKDLHPVATRLIHACGMVDLPQDLSFSDDIYTAAHTALTNGAPILCDCEMVGAGIIRRYLSENEVIVTLNDPRTPNLSANLKTTRSAAAVELWRDHIEGAIVAIGNAPTALFHLLEKLDQGWPKPAAILAFPVGFVGAAESKAALSANPGNTPFIALQGRRGGSAMASAAVNAFAAGLPEDTQ